MMGLLQIKLFVTCKTGYEFFVFFSIFSINNHIQISAREKKNNISLSSKEAKNKNITLSFICEIFKLLILSVMLKWNKRYIFIKQERESNRNMFCPEKRMTSFSIGILS